MTAQVYEVTALAAPVVFTRLYAFLALWPPDILTARFNVVKYMASTHATPITLGTL